MTAAALGAARVWAVDVDAAAVALCSASARANGLPAVRAVTGVLLDPLPADSPLDLVVAVMPQKPSNSAFSARYAGGADGADLVCAAIDAAAARLSSGGRLLVYHHSVAHPARVEAALARSFEWSTAASRLRCFGAQRYERQAPGMLAHLSALAEAGTVDVRIGAAHLVWRSRVIAAVRR